MLLCLIPTLIFGTELLTVRCLFTCVSSASQHKDVNCTRAEIVSVLFRDNYSEPRNGCSGSMPGTRNNLLKIGGRKETHAFFMDLGWVMEFTFSFFKKPL